MMKKAEMRRARKYGKIRRVPLLKEYTFTPVDWVTLVRVVVWLRESIDMVMFCNRFCIFAALMSKTGAVAGPPEYSSESSIIVFAGCRACRT